MPARCKTCQRDQHLGQTCLQVIQAGGGTKGEAVERVARAAGLVKASTPTPREAWGARAKRTVTKVVTEPVTEMEPVTKGRPKVYGSVAERMRAYRMRKAGG